MELRVSSMPKIKSPGRVDFNRAKKVAYVTYSLGNVDGKYKRVYHTITDVATKAEAREKAEEWRREYNAGTAYKGRTVEEYASSWLKEREELGQVKNSTLAHDGYDLKKINGEIGDMLVADVTPDTVRQLMKSLGRYSASTTNQVHKTLKAVMSRAVEDGIITKNPTSKVKPPQRPKTTRKPLSVEESARFMQLMFAEPKSGYVAACVIGMATGCRRGEAIAITWDDWDGTVLSIDKQYTSFDGTHGLKGNGEPRKVSVGANAAKWIKEWGSECQTGSEFICSNNVGGMILPDNLRRWWGKWCVRNGFAVMRDPDGNEVPLDDDGWPLDQDGKRFSRVNKKPKLHYDGLKFHELRHTQTSVLIAAGVDIKTVQARGGWTTPRVPLEVYAHVMREQDGMAADVFEKAVLGG